jgi:hypothetical protein
VGFYFEGGPMFEVGPLVEPLDPTNEAWYFAHRNKRRGRHIHQLLGVWWSLRLIFLTTSDTKTRKLCLLLDTIINSYWTFHGPWFICTRQGMEGSKFPLVKDYGQFCGLTVFMAFAIIILSNGVNIWLERTKIKKDDNESINEVKNQENRRLYSPTF